MFVSATQEGTPMSSLMSVSEPVPQRFTLPANAVIAPEFIPMSFLNQEFVPGTASDMKTIFKNPPVE